MKKTVRLNIAERVNLMGVLPGEGDILTLRIVRDLQQELALSDDELTKFVGVGNQLTREGLEYRKTLRLGDNTVSVVVNKLKELNDKKALKVQCISLYERFVEGKVLPEEAEVEAKEKAAEAAVSVANQQ